MSPTPPRRSNHWRFVVGLLVGLAVIAFAIQQLTLQFGTDSHAGQVENGGRQAVDSTDETAMVESDTIACLGRIEPGSEVVSVNAAVVDVIDAVLVQRGDTVTQGQELARLQSQAERQAECNWITSQIAEAEAHRAAVDAYHAARVQTAETTLRRIERSYPLRRESLQPALRSFEAEVKVADRDLKRAEQLLKANSLPESEWDARWLTLRRHEEALSKAQAVLAELDGEFELERDEAAATVQERVAERQRAVHAIALESLKRQLVFAQTRLEQAVVRSPLTGRVLNVRCRPGEKTVDTPLLSLGDTSWMQVVAEVYETDIARVRVGQRAWIRSRVLTQPVHGVVEHVGVIVHKNDVLSVDPTASVDARIVEVRVRLSDADAVADLSNHQVDVWIDVSNASPK